MPEEPLNGDEALRQLAEVRLFERLGVALKEAAQKGGLFSQPSFWWTKWKDAPDLAAKRQVLHNLREAVSPLNQVLAMHDQGMEHSA